MKRNKHSLSHYRLLSMDMGRLVPIGWYEVLPGDTVQQATSALVRAAPLVSPVMHPLSVRIHHWYVPYRLLWNGWENFITGGPTGTDAALWPTWNIGTGGVTIGSLADYLGIPTGTTAAANLVSTLPFRAYQKIWNEFYRDEDLETEVVVSDAGDGTDTAAIFDIRNVAWEKDYFTSSRPWEQKGPAVALPLGNTAPVRGLGIAGGQATAPATAYATLPAHDWSGTPSWSANQLYLQATATGTSPTVRPQIYADLSNATAATVNQLRQAMAIQRFEEARARYGSRYTEYLRYLGVRSSDGRLQRPEYLGGGKQTIQFSEVLQTGPSAAPDQANVVGALKGHGIGAMRSNRYRRFIEEHGLVISLMSIRPKSMYMNSLEKKFHRRVKEQVWQKELEHIGQQQILNKEVYSAHATPDGVFGYQDRYDEYRRAESGVSGEFRTILNYWHLARDFGSAPALNASFVSCVPTMRTFASAATDPFYVMCNHSIQARRLVARTGKSYIF